MSGDNHDSDASRPSNNEMPADPHSPPPRADAERVAALLDGRLDAAARAALLAELDASPEAFADYAEAIALVRAVEGEARDRAGAAAVTPLRRRRPVDRRVLVWAAAAAIVLAVGIPLARRDRAADVAPVSRAVALLGPATLPDEWNEDPWGASRGADDGFGARARATRVGARLVDLHLVAHAGGSAAARAASRVAVLLDGAPGGSAAAARFRALAEGSGVPDSASLTRASGEAEQALGEADVRVGAWLESARAAAVRGDAAFFDAAEWRSAMRVVRERAGGLGEVEALERASEARPRDMTAVGRAAAMLLGALGR